MEIRTFDQLWQAVEGRMDAFAQAGCRLSDHGVDHITPRMATPEELETLFCRTLAGQVPTPQEADAFRMGMLLCLTRLNARKGFRSRVYSTITTILLFSANLHPPKNHTMKIPRIPQRPAIVSNVVLVRVPVRSIFRFVIF